MENVIPENIENNFFCIVCFFLLSWEIKWMTPKMSQNSPLIIEHDQYFNIFDGFIKHFSLNENYFFITLVFLYGEGW